MNNSPLLTDELIGTDQEWEHRTFIYPFPPNAMRARLGRLLDTVVTAKRQFWQKSKDSIWLELQRWLDSGWEPTGEVGADCIDICIDTPLVENGIRFILGIFLGASDWSDTHRYVKPVAFRLAMRRPKNSPTVPSRYTRQQAEVQEAQNDRRELEGKFAYQLGQSIRRLFGGKQ